MNEDDLQPRTDLDEQTNISSSIPGIFSRFYSQQKSIYALYSKYKMFFMGLMAPALVVGYVAIHLVEHQIQSIAQERLRGVEGGFGYNHQSLEALKGTLLPFIALRISGYLVCWLAFCFSFAAISVAVHRTINGLDISIHECFQQVRENTASWLLVSLILAGIMGLGVAGEFGVGYMMALVAFKLSLSIWFVHGMSAVVFVIVITFFARFILAIPFVVLDGTRPGQAFYDSTLIMDENLIWVMYLILKSIVLVYIAQEFPFWILRVFSITNIDTWQWWTLWSIGMVGVLYVQPILFIGLSQLQHDRKQMINPLL